MIADLLDEVLGHLGDAVDALDGKDCEAASDVPVLKELIESMQDERQQALDLLDEASRQDEEALSREYERSVL